MKTSQATLSEFQNLALLVQKSQAVNAECLTPVVISLDMDNDIKDWAHEFIEPKECFTNAYSVSSLFPNSAYVLGFVYLPDCGLVIEHAWNMNEKTGEHFDLTAAMFWAESASQGHYFTFAVFR